MSVDALDINPTRWKTVILNDVCEGIMGFPHRRDELSDEQHEGFHRYIRLAPQPPVWDQFYMLLISHAEENGITEEPPLPCILGGAGASPSQKRNQLMEQIRWAATHGCFESVDTFLRNLDADRWEPFHYNNENQ